MSRKLIRYFAGIRDGRSYTGIDRVTLQFKQVYQSVYAIFPDGTRCRVGYPDTITEKELNLLGYFKTQREALMHAQMKLKSHTRRLQKWRKENREHLAEVKGLLEECK